jgi:membrane protein YqaA with SNARE-associated domain
MAPELPQGPLQTGAMAPAAIAWWQTDAARRWLGGVVVVLITLVSFWIAFNPQWVSGLGRWGYVGAFFISMIASATIVLPAPGLAIVIAMGRALDPVLLGIVAGVGSAIGELSGYIAGSTGRVLIPEDRKRQIDTLERLTRKYGAVLLLVLAALPFPLFDFAGIVAGMLKMRVWTYISAVAIGKSIKYIILILIGTGSLQILQRWFG